MALVLSDRTSDGQQDERRRELRDLIVEAGLEVLERDGLGLRGDSITYARVFEYLETEHGVRITRGSVHKRIWASLDEFRAEVLTTAARDALPGQDGLGMHAAIVDVLATVDEPGVDHDQRLRAFCRIAGHSLLTAHLRSNEFRRFQAIKTAARVGPDDAATALLRSIVREKADGNGSDRLDRFRFMFRALGLRAHSSLDLDEDTAIDLFLTVIQLLVTGAHLDHHGGFTTMASEVATDLPADDDHPWTYFGFGFLAAMNLLFEPDRSAPCPRPKRQPAAVSNTHSPVGLNRTRIPALDRPRRTRSELRRLVVAAGVHLFMRDGLRLQPESLTYAAVFAHIERTRGITIHRATVHREIWSSQEEFRADILAEAARYGPDESLDTMQRTMADQRVTRNPDGSVNVRQLILDNSLATTSAQMRVAATSQTFRRWQSIKASLLSAPDVNHSGDDGTGSGAAADHDGPAERSGDAGHDHTAERGSGTDHTTAMLRSAVNRRYEDMLAVFIDTYRSVLPLVGLQVNPELRLGEDQAYHLFAVLCAAITTGSDYDISAGATSAARSFPLPRADGSDTTDPWPVPAIASLAALDLLFVPVSDSSSKAASPQSPLEPCPGT
ncbi:MAG: hypothetical protein WBM50_19245 [Acidimicrobiales bacterium]